MIIIGNEEQQIDTRILENQILDVKVSSFESTSKFYIVILTAVECKKSKLKCMDDNNSEVCFL